MHDRVEKLAQQLDKLDGVEAPAEATEAPSAPTKRPGPLGRLWQTPITSTLAIITVMLCALVLKSVVFDSPASTDTGYVSSSETHLQVDDRNIKPPMLRVNHSTDRYIDYTVFVHADDRAAAQNMELYLSQPYKAWKPVHVGSCLISSKDTLVVKTCRTQISYGTKNGEYRLRAELTGSKRLDSSAFKLTTKPAQP